MTSRLPCLKRSKHKSVTRATRNETEEWREWAGACNGVLYRFKACAEHSDLLRGSLALSTSPPQPERYEQEKLLYNFFVEGLSAIECFYYGAYFIGALVDSAIDSAVDRKAVNPAFVTDHFQNALPEAPLTAVMRQVRESAEFDAWRLARNVLTHRVAPGRDFRTGGDDPGTYWMGGSLDANSILIRRSWLASTLTELLTSLEALVASRV